MSRRRHCPPLSLVPFFVCLAIVAACTPARQARVAPPRPAQQLAAVALLPVTSPPADPRQPPDKALETGRSVLQKAVAAVLQEQGIRLVPVPANALESLGNATPAEPGAVREIARRFGADGVLAVELRHYRDRQGSTYAAAQPAAVAFSYRLTAADGTTLCAGTVEAEQQSVLANLFHFSFKRGFHWLSGPEFVRETVAEKFATCPELTSR